MIAIIVFLLQYTMVKKRATQQAALIIFSIAAGAGFKPAPLPLNRHRLKLLLLPLKS